MFFSEQNTSLRMTKNNLDKSNENPIRPSSTYQQQQQQQQHTNKHTRTHTRAQTHMHTHLHTNTRT